MFLKSSTHFSSGVESRRVRSHPSGLRTLTGAILLSVLMLGGHSLSAQAQETVAAGAVKLGYVDAVRLIEQAPQGEQALKKLEEEFGPRDSEIKQLRDEIRNLEDELEKNALVMQEDDQRTKEEALREKQRRLKRVRQEFREDYNVRRNEELADLQRVVTKAIVEIAKAEGYDLILQESVYASPSIDITEQVLEKLRADGGQ